VTAAIMPHPSIPRPWSNSRALRNVVLSAFLFSPIVVVALMLLFAVKVPTSLAPLGRGPNAQSPMHGRAASTTTPAVAPSQPAKLVQPESLPQGFILIVEDRAKLAGQASPIYLAGSMNGWNPGDANFKLTAQSDMLWRIQLPQPKNGEPIEFKFTRGSWKLEELVDDLSSPGNRTLPKIDVSKLKAGEIPTIELSVAKWGDQKTDYVPDAGNPAYAPINATGNLKRLQMVGGSGGAEGRTRDCLVWLPPGYDDAANAKKTYPVLYLFDAQNLFSKAASAPDEWSVDETATELISKKKVEPFIVVGLPHGSGARMSEYLPVAAIPGVTPAGAEFVSMLMTQVMPRVERGFRVKTGPESTAIGGSSLGAAMALYAATSHPEVFGSVLAESLPFDAATQPSWESYLSGVKVWPGRLYLGMGGQETGPEPAKAERNKAYVAAVRALDARIAKDSPRTVRLVVVDEAAEHNEGAWGKRLPGALGFLYERK